MIYWLWVPETRSVPLEELAVLFGDMEDVKVYSNDLFVNENHEVGVDREHAGDILDEKKQTRSVNDAVHSESSNL